MHNARTDYFVYRQRTPHMKIREKDIKIQGRFLKVARLADGYDFVEDPDAVVRELRGCGTRIDIFTFVQRLGETSPKYGYAMELDNFAALPVSTFDHWFTKQINGKTRNLIRKAEKLGVTVREVDFDDALVKGIREINNESPVRQGRPFWHYGDDLETVQRKYGTYLDRSVFLGVFFEENLIGYAKIVADEKREQAGLMQILSMISHRDKSPNNVIVAEAVRSCARRGIPHLFYANFVYGKNGQDSLGNFKKYNGFERVDIPRYYVPLTPLGSAALRFGLHRGVRAYLPSLLVRQARKFRDGWYAKRFKAPEDVHS